MAKLILSAPAEVDMFELWAFIAKDNLAAADRVVDRLDKAFARIAKYPRLGQVHEHLVREFRRASRSRPTS